MFPTIKMKKKVMKLNKKHKLNVTEARRFVQKKHYKCALTLKTSA
jgi:hypothetical protein